MASAERYLKRPITGVRRKDRILDDAEWMDRFVERAPVGNLAYAHDGQPMLHNNLYWFDGDATIYMHTAGVGRLRAIIDLGEIPACFSVMEHGRLLPANTPYDFSTEYANVVMYGKLGVLTDRAEKKAALEGLMAKYAPQLVPGRDYVPMPDSDIDLTSVFRFRIEQRVGKHNVKPEDYPAFPYPGESFIDAERDAGRVTMKAMELA